jgi:hypothetical protein
MKQGYHDGISTNLKANKTIEYVEQKYRNYGTKHNYKKNKASEGTIQI